MNTPEETEEPTLVDLAERFDSEGMIGFVRNAVDDLRKGFAAVNATHFPWLDDLKRAPWSGVLCLGMGAVPREEISSPHLPLQTVTVP